MSSPDVIVQLEPQILGSLASENPFSAMNAIESVIETPGTLESGESDDDDETSAADPEPDPFVRGKAEQQAWVQARERLQALSLTMDRSSAGELTPFARRIDAGFQFWTEEEDADFSPFHVEPLLDQAADLLDRGVRDRATWDELGSKWVNLVLELVEYAELDAIHTEEEAAGVYDVTRLQSRADLGAENVNAFEQKRLQEYVDATLQLLFSGDELNKQFNSARMAAWIGGLVPYTWKDQVFTGYVKHKWDNVEKTIADWAVQAAEAQSNHWLASRLRELVVQRQVYSTISRVSSERTSGLAARAAWERENANFLRRRTIVARRLQDMKVRLATDADGLLNHEKRLEGLRSRFEQDFRDAFARLKAAEIGLRRLYGYDEPLPSDCTSVGFFDDCLLWTRRAIQWLVRFSRQEQSFVLPISVRSIIGDSAWRDGERKGGWEFDVNGIGEIGVTHVRLRGVSATTTYEGRRVLWQMRLYAPRTGTVYGSDGTIAVLNQKGIPPVLLGRVTSRESVRSPDVVGITSLHNVSPFGKWKLEVIGSVPQEEISELSDIELDLHLAYRRPVRNNRSAEA